MRLVLKILIAAVCLLVLIWTPFLFLAAREETIRPAVIRGPAIYFANKASECSLFQSYRAAFDNDASDQAVRSLRSESTLLATDGAIEQWRTRFGDLWASRGSEHSLFFTLWEQSIDIYGVEDNGVRPGDVVFDVGAQYGVFTRKALEAGAQLVVAVEPAPTAVECLRRNLRADIASGRVIVYPKGAWDKDDVLEMRLPNDNPGANSFVYRPDNSTTLKLPLTTIDNIAADLRLKRIDFIKMDIEGAERNALLGARHVVSRDQPRMAIAAYHLPDDPEAIRASVPGIYSVECRRCTQWFNVVRPLVLHFTPAAERNLSH